MKIYNLHSPEILACMTIPKVYAYYFTQWHGFEMKTHHAHPWMEIMYVVHGQCHVHFENQSFQMKHGDFIFIDAQVAHRLVLAPDDTCRMLNIEFAFEGTLNQDEVICPISHLIEQDESLQSMIHQNQPYHLLKDIDEVYPILMSLIQELSIEQRKSNHLIQLQITQLLLFIARQSLDAMQNTSSTDPYVRKAIHFMNQKYDAPLCASDIAAEVNLHPNYLHRIFKKATQTTLVDYLTTIRVEKAKMFLVRTDIPIIDISDYIGMNSRQYFSYVFKKKTGLTPAEFRNKARISDISNNY